MLGRARSGEHGRQVKKKSTTSCTVTTIASSPFVSPGFGATGTMASALTAVGKRTANGLKSRQLCPLDR